MPSEAMIPEIIDCIIDHLGTEQETLKLCSSVCRSWLPRSRYHLFNISQFVVSSQNILPFLDLLESPHSTLSKSLRALTIRETEIRYQTEPMESSLQKLCGALPAIEWFTLQNIDWWGLQQTSKTALMSLLAKVPEVHFDRVDFDTHLELLGVLYKLPSLKTLSVTQVFLDNRRHRGINAAMTPLPDQLPSLILRSLTIELKGIGREVFRWLKNNRAFPKCLEEIEIYSVDVISIMELLTLIDPQLKRIKLGVEARRIDGLRLATSGCGILESLELFDLSLDSYTVAALVQLFSEYAVSPPRLREISFRCVVFNPYATHATFPEWARLDRVLSTPHFASLRTLKLIIANIHPLGRVSEEDINGWENLRVLRNGIVECLPLCHQRGILR